MPPYGADGLKIDDTRPRVRLVGRRLDAGFSFLLGVLGWVEQIGDGDVALEFLMECICEGF